MFDELRMILANIKNYVITLSKENEILRKEVLRLREENSKLKEEK